MDAAYWLFATIFGLFLTAIFYASGAGCWSWLAFVACCFIAAQIIKNKGNNDDY